MVQSGVQALLTNPQRKRFYGIDSPTITPFEWNENKKLLFSATLEKS